MQLVAYGAQDIYLTGNPQITFFKVVYRRHTNFSMEAIEQTLNGTAGYGNKVSATISRNGDLVHRMYVEHFFTRVDSNGATLQQCNNFGHALIKDVELEIGGQKIDKHYGRWMQIWSDLTEFNPTGASVAATAATGTNYGQKTGNTLFNKMSGNGRGSAQIDTNSANADYNLFIPLQFWFNRNPGLALPLIALQYHEVKVMINFEAETKIHNDTNASAAGLTSETFKLWADYIYLDTDERRRFAQVSHEYLIEQLQYIDKSSTGATGNHDLTFNHPVKELIWQFSNSVEEVALGDAAAGATTAGDASTLACGNPMITGEFQLKLNGHDRFAARDFRYFSRTQVWQHHTGYGGTSASDSIGVYSFALKPEEHQPSGTCNFSRIDNAQLAIKTAVTFTSAGAAVPGRGTASNLHIYAVNYNVLRIMSGMGGLAYSN